MAKLICKNKIEAWSEINGLFVIPAIDKSKNASIKITKDRFQCILTMNKAEWEKLKRQVNQTIIKNV